MKKIRIGLLFALAALLALLLLAVPRRAEAATLPTVSGPYDYTVEDYAVEMEVGEDLRIEVKEVMRVSFTGYDSHGIIRDFPLGGQTYADFEVSCDNSDFSPYTEAGGGVLSWYLRGAGRVTNQERTYTLRYAVRTDLKDGVLPVDVLGYGMTADIGHFSARIVLPAGYTSCDVYSGGAGTRENLAGVSLRTEQEGEKTVLSFEGKFPVVSGNFSNGTPCSYGVTLALHFEEGTVGAPFETALLYSLAMSGLLLLAAIILRAAVGRQPLLIRTVNLSAPKSMDPLMMGKLIDGKVDGEDLGALIFWFASEGYLKIDLRDEDDPVLHRTALALPDDMPAHRKLFYEGLFADGKKKVSMHELAGSFYPTAQAVKHTVNAAAGKLYTGRGGVVLAIVALLSALVAGVYPLVYGMVTVTGDYFFFEPLFFLLFAFVPCALCFRLAAQMKYKWKRGICIALCAGALLIGGVSAVLAALVRGAAMSAAAVSIPVAASAVAGAVAGNCLVRTKTHTERLGQVLGFKDFILYAEKDRISFMMKENPELYYQILPYAQVLGVTDIWTEKFEGLDLQPPAYFYGPADMLFDCMMWHTVFCTFNRAFVPATVSRPAVSGRGNFGGGFGGFGGGGFGGGGMRGC